MKLQLLIAILLIGYSTQQCTIGCLRCNTLNQCVLCDITNNYFLNGNSCSLTTQTNCLLLAQNGNCVSCNNNFYLDVNSQRCLSVTTANVVANCVTYNSGQVCTSCTGNFFIAAGRCSAVNITITNCNSYIGNGVCAGCSNGFIQSNDFNSCVAIPSNNNCLVYTFIGCRACSAGFINNPNFYFTSLPSPSFSNWFLQNMIVPTSSWLQLSVCQPITVSNCAITATFNFCTLCMPGFFLQNGNCVAFPLPIIFGCLTYTTLITCSVCQAGMFLNQNTCQNNVVIPNCMTYSGAFSTTTCVQCVNTFFLQGNACVARSVSVNIQNCQANSITADICATCGNGFFLTSDSRSCLAVISNCAQYSSSTFQTTVLQCSLCNNGFYLTSAGTTTVCVAGTIQNCLTYTINSNTCTVCNNGWFLSANLCVAHIVIQNCLTYDPLRANFCSVCNSGFYNFALTTVCVQTTIRSGCASYSVDGNSCSTCLPGFFLASGNCNLIPSAFANCNLFSVQCTLCNAGYMVNSLPTVGTCTLPLDYINSANNSPCAVMQPTVSTITPTWQQASTTSQAPMTCLTCNTYMYAYAPQGNEAICVNSNQLTLYSGFAAVTQCSRYGLNYAATQVIVCMQCNSGFFISGYQALAIQSTATTCVSSCSLSATASNMIIPDDFFGFVNICIAVNAAAVGFPNTPGNCQRTARFQSTTIASNPSANFHNDFRCFIAGPASATAATVASSFMQLTLANAVFYPFEMPSQTTPLTASTDFTSGYSNTVDATSTFPTVFNYHGLLTGITEVSATIAAATLQLNNLANCDIVVSYIANYAKGGFAFDTAATLYTFAVAANPYFSCFRCAFGFQLTYTPMGTAASNAPFPSCQQMTNCVSSNTVYGGLPQFLNSVFSCHICSQSSGASTFPSVYFESDAGTAAVSQGIWSGWSVTGVYGSVSTIATGFANHGFRCAPAPTAIIATDTAAFTTTTPFSNCAAYGYITPMTAYTLPFGTMTVRNVCLACAANFFPTYLTTVTNTAATTTGALTNNRLPNFIVSGCTASANCDNTFISQFNSCGRCRSDLENALVPSYFAFIDFTLSNCYQTSAQNCFLLVASPFSNTANNNVCSVCKAGFFKNSDGMCEVYRVPNQSTNTGIFVNAYYTSRVYLQNVLTVPSAGTPNVDAQIVRIHYLLSFRQLQYGVNSCTSGWVQAPANTWAPRICVWSSYVYNNTGTYPTTSVFINNCVRYNVTLINLKNVCGGCNVGFIPTIDGLNCVSNSGIPNCAFSQTGSNTGLCFQCNVNFFNVNGQCVATTIPNCATYVNGLWSFSTPGTLQCATCLNGFFLSNDFLVCSPGNVMNCISYNQGQASQCSNCADRFVLLTLGNIFYCYPIPVSLNCALLQDTSSTSGANLATISCARCNANNVQVFGTRTWNTLGLTSLAQTLCMPFNLIANCVSYDQANSIIRSNSFTCLQCATGFWFSTGNSTCVQRSNLPSQCVTFSLTADVCTLCSSGSFLSANGQQCISFPNGIFNCNQYSAATTCIQCNAGSFLSNNACVTSTVINNCAVYSANFTCSACARGFFLSNSTSCVTPTATNCITFTSINACASCAIGFGLQTTNGVTSCVSVSLPNCINATSVAPFTCLVCNTGFFPSTAGQCTVIAQTISNCLIYDSATTCVTCSPSTVLNVARTACNSTFYSSLVDPNCAQSFLVNTPNCLDCALGSFFSNGTCVSCSNNTLASGCLSCDPTNNNVCLICRPTFFMNSQGACVANNPNPTPIPVPTPTPNATSTITKAIAMSVALVTIYFDRF